ncbi:hypothetical protein [Chroococcidiopsis sp. CCMEE 29]|uniref:hypothetical protein n=1 Tax=Chroococcidiopsis sp. CCMEE 29 TaxID=155894 RepID=UPI00201FF622|nr:hypothetical protein [Chroococcidiopsis sp. CCMEE 29]
MVAIQDRKLQKSIHLPISVVLAVEEMARVRGVSFASIVVEVMTRFVESQKAEEKNG